MMNKPPTGLVIKNRPLPSDGGYKDMIKDGLSKLREGECLEAPMPSDYNRTIINWQRYVSTVAYNYRVKTQINTRFSVLIIDDNTVGIWIK